MTPTDALFTGSMDPERLTFDEADAVNLAAWWDRPLLDAPVPVSAYAGTPGAPQVAHDNPDAWALVPRWVLDAHAMTVAEAVTHMAGLPTEADPP